MKIKNIFKGLILKGIIPIYYSIMKFINQETVDFLFIETNNKNISFSFQEFYELVTSKQYTTKVIYIDDLTKKGRLFRYLSSLKMISKSKIIVLNDGYITLNYINLRDKYVLQLWHASGIFKKFGYSIVDTKYLNNQDFKKFPIHRNYDLVTVSSDYVSQFYEQALNITEKNIVQSLGTSRTDYYFNQENYRNASRKLTGVVSAMDKKIVLYAPTFRGRLNQYQEYDIDLEFLRKELSDEYIIILKLHPLISGHNLEVDNKFSYDLTSQMEFHELALISDILVTDFSSTIFDWSLLEKPAISYASDLNEYKLDRGLYIEYEEFFPGPITKNSEELVEAIKKGETKNIVSFKDKFMGSCDGFSSERILETVVSKINEES